MTVTRLGSWKDGDMTANENKSKITSPPPPGQQLSSASLVEISREYTGLTQRGHRWIGLCPLHAEKTPSFSIDDEKNLFYCHGCHTGGDIIRFVELVENVDFKTAVQHLGLSHSIPKLDRRDQQVKQAARALRAWSSKLLNRIAARLRDIGHRMDINNEISESLLYVDPVIDTELKSLRRQWEILSDLHDDLWIATIDVWKERRAIEGLLRSEPEDSTAELAAFFPPLTAEYRERLRDYARGVGERGWGGVR